ncbi:hypothetical protein [Bordetella genomosp. 4]|uniref:hypothetical protein n=1 Tax=Bordetella genomosp. 4 TaxID=463044 RepID=UPI000B9E01EB|nr:hypothetical protein [Bordetella genomosp. 4]OZI43143.1 hypothetical protein CAL21_20325 [Bordetella genomosp. 4]
MNKTTLSGAIGALVLFPVLCTAAASPPSSTSLTAEQRQQLDTDRNGNVSQTEYRAFMDAAFGKLDADSDGYLAKNDFPKEVTESQFVAMDTNRDGRVAKAEFMTQVMKDYTAGK